MECIVTSRPGALKTEAACMLNEEVRNDALTEQAPDADVFGP